MLCKHSPGGQDWGYSWIWGHLNLMLNHKRKQKPGLEKGKLFWERGKAYHDRLKWKLPGHYWGEATIVFHRFTLNWRECIFRPIKATPSFSGPSARWKCRLPCSKITENFKTAEHQTQHRILLSTRPWYALEAGSDYCLKGESVGLSDSLWAIGWRHDIWEREVSEWQLFWLLYQNGFNLGSITDPVFYEDQEGGRNLLGSQTLKYG